MKKRNTNIEILRIIACILIILSHYIVHSQIDIYKLPLSLNKYILEISTLGNLGTNIFILISGYYQVEDKTLNIKKLIKLYINVLFYSLGIYILTIILKKEPFNIYNLIKYTAPITTKTYWFASAYTILYIFHPYINTILNTQDKKTNQKFIITQILIFSLLRFITTSNYYANELIEIIMIYTLGAYIKKYNPIPNNKTNKKILTLTITSLLLIILILDILKLNLNYETFILTRTSPFILIISITLLNIFINKKPTYNKTINTISSTTFSIYLISEHPYIKKYLWQSLFNLNNYINTKLLIPNIIITISRVFITCFIIDYLRQKIFNIIYNKFKQMIAWIYFNFTIVLIMKFCYNTCDVLRKWVVWKEEIGVYQKVFMK